MCFGVKDDATACLECLKCTEGLKQDADDMCMICFTDTLDSAPVIKVGTMFAFSQTLANVRDTRKDPGRKITTFKLLYCT